MIAAAVVTAAIAGGSTAAVAATTGDKPVGPAKIISASAEPAGAKSAEERQGHDAMTVAVARELHLSADRVGAALRPLFAAGRADTSSLAFVAAARSLGVSTQQLNTALMHAKQSLAASMHIKQRPGGAKSAGAKSAEGWQGHDAMTAAVARELHLSADRVGAALRPLFAAGRADTSSSAFVAAARSLGVSTQQLNTALMHAKQSLASGS
jgi:hypothetical protein